MKKGFKVLLFVVLLGVPFFALKAASTSSSVKGKIFLQVEDKGQAYYVSPKDGQAYYMANGNDAFKVMRSMGVGVSNTDMNKIKTDANFRKKFMGKILLQVQDKGQAYYISFDGRYNYLKDGAAAYDVMRKLGVGISNNNLKNIKVVSATNASLDVRADKSNNVDNGNSVSTNVATNTTVKPDATAKPNTISNNQQAVITENVGQIDYQNPNYTCDEINNNDTCTYNVVKICDKTGKRCQQWLKENLNIGKYTESRMSSSSEFANCVNIGNSDVPSWSCQIDSGLQKYCYGKVAQSGGLEKNCQTDGGLYEWSEAMGLPAKCNRASYDKNRGASDSSCTLSSTSNIQGICPNGFHIPNRQEFVQLAKNVINDQFCDPLYGGCKPAGHKLKKRMNLIDYTANRTLTTGKGCDASVREDGSEKDDSDCGSSGFEALFTGMRDDIQGTFDGRGQDTIFWTANPIDNAAYCFGVGDGNSTISQNLIGKTNGLSIRCIKD
ncbi:MAG: FISUMP domain-containing protein [Candidatus Falkowbacteria bacterium]